MSFNAKHREERIRLLQQCLEEMRAARDEYRQKERKCAALMANYESQLRDLTGKGIQYSLPLSA